MILLQRLAWGKVDEVMGQLNMGNVFVVDLAKHLGFLWEEGLVLLVLPMQVRCQLLPSPMIL